MSKPIDITRVTKTRDGSPVSDLRDNLPKSIYTICGFVGGAMLTWTSDGQFVIGGSAHPRDLIEDPLPTSSETPRTDAEIERIHNSTEDYAWKEFTEFTKQLEIELNEANKALDTIAIFASRKGGQA